MNTISSEERIKRFFNGRELTFCIERFGDNDEEWVARCDQIPAISTSGYGFDERAIREQVKDAVLTAAGITESDSENLLREFSFVNALTARV